MIYLLVFFILTTVIFAYLSYVSYIKYNKALKYTEAYVAFVSNLYFMFVDTKEKMDEIDFRGSFRADDEVGHTFNALKDCIDYLYEFITKYVNKETESKED